VSARSNSHFPDTAFIEAAYEEKAATSVVTTFVSKQFEGKKKKG